MKKKANIIGFIFSLAVIIYVLLKLDWQAVYMIFAQLDIRWLIAAFGVYLVNYVLRSMRFRILLNLDEVPFQSLLGVTNLYGMFLYLMPAKSGELSYPLLLKSHLDIPLPESTATLIAARFFDFATVALFLPAILVNFWSQIHPWIQFGALLFVLAVFSLGFGLIWFIRQPERMEHIQHIRISSQTIVVRIWNAISKLLNSLQSIDQRRQYGRLWFITIAIWICVQTNFYFIVLSLGESLAFWQMIVVALIMVPMTLLPIQGFGNLGTHEFGWAAAFALFGYSETTALNIAISSHMILLFFVLLLGALGILLLKNKPEIR